MALTQKRRDKVKAAFVSAYQEGFDPVKKTLDGATLNEKNLNFLFNPITMATAFLGMSNHLVNGATQQSWLNIFHNFIGWETDVTAAKKVFNALVVAPVLTPYHVLRMLFKIPVNLLALATEFMPNVGGILFKEMADWAKKQAQSTNDPVIKGLASLGYYAASAARFACHGISFLGRAVTSPLQALRLSFYEGQKMAKRITGNSESLGAKALGWTFGLSAAVLSAAVTGVVYTFAFPAAVHLVTATVAPAIISHLPSVVTSALAPVAKVASTALNWIDTRIINKIGFGLEGMFKMVGICMSPTVAVATGKGVFRATSSAGKNVIDIFVRKSIDYSRGADTNTQTKTSLANPSTTASLSKSLGINEEDKTTVFSSTRGSACALDSSRTTNNDFNLYRSVDIARNPTQQGNQNTNSTPRKYN